MRYATLTDGIVDNIVTAAEDWIAAQENPDAFIPYSAENLAFIGGPRIGGVFYPPQPFPSWMAVDGRWQPPTPMPAEGEWSWDEDTLTWVSLT